MAMKSETREVHDCNEVALQGVGDLLLTQGDQEGLTIEADETVLQKLKTEVQNGRLVIGFKSWLDGILSFNTGKIIFRVSMKRVNGVSISGAGTLAAKEIKTDQCALRVSGSGDMDIDHYEGQSLDIHVSGTGRVDLGGKADKLQLHISGSGNVKAQGFQCQDAEVEVSGAGSVVVDAVKSLRVHISGSGNVKYVGNPALVQQISGVGRVEQVAR